MHSVINVLSLENEYSEFDCEMFGFYPVSLPLGTVQATDVAFSCYSLSHLLTQQYYIFDNTHPSWYCGSFHLFFFLSY